MANLSLGIIDLFEDLLGEADYIRGEQGNDSILGGLLDDLLDGGEGNDTLLGGDGADTLMGGEGTDVLRGGDGNDVIYADLADLTAGIVDGGKGTDSLVILDPGSVGVDISLATLGIEAVYSGNGNDTICGAGKREALLVLAGDGDDSVTGGAGNDSLYGGTGRDALLGGNGNDVLVGEDGNDTAYGGQGTDELHGGAGDDSLNGNLGDDYLVGGADNDKLIGGNGNDLIDAGDGNDTIVGGFGGGNGNNTIYLGDGNDLLELVLDANSMAINNGSNDTVVDFDLAEDRLFLNGNTGGSVQHLINALFGGDRTAARGAYNDVLQLLDDNPMSAPNRAYITGAELQDFVDMIQGQNVAGYSATDVGGTLVLQLGGYQLSLLGHGSLA